MDLPNKALFRISEVAELLDIPKRTLYNKINSGEVPAEHLVTNLGPWRIKRAYLRSFIDAGDTATNTATQPAAS